MLEMSKTWRVIKDGVIVADGLTSPSYEDPLTDSATRTYRVEAWEEATAQGGYATVAVEVVPSGNVWLSNSNALTWDDLPTQDADNGTLTQVGSSFQPGSVELWRYSASFAWDNSDHFSRPNGLDWLVSLEALENLVEGERAFAGGTNLGLPAAGVDAGAAFDNLDLSGVTTLKAGFLDCAHFNHDISGWDVSGVESFQALFSGATAFSVPIGGWNVCAANNMAGMFYKAASFSKDLSSWKVPLIVAKPTQFDVGSGFEGVSALQPQWGVSCA